MCPRIPYLKAQEDLRGQKVLNHHKYCKFNTSAFYKSPKAIHPYSCAMSLDLKLETFFWQPTAHPKPYFLTSIHIERGRENMSGA